jgi:hypothetical protein
MSDEDELLPLTAVAARLDVGPRTLLYWARHYGFPVFLVRGRPFVWWQAVQAWARAGGVSR